MKKTDLFRQIGWSQELIEHFTIIEDSNNYSDELISELPETFEAATTIIKYDVSAANTNITF